MSNIVGDGASLPKIVIQRNGETVVITGWRAWLLSIGAAIAVWLLLMLLAFVWIGASITLALIVLLALPAALIVMALHALGRAFR